MQCYRPTHGTRFLRWCEVRLGEREGEGEKEGEGEGKDGASQKEMGQKKGRSQNGGSLQALVVRWEVPLVDGASWAVETYNNDGQDDRKVVYTLQKGGVLCVYNVNGLVCEFNGLQQACVGEVFCGIMLQPLPLGCEQAESKSRACVLSTQSGNYYECVLDSVHEGEGSARKEGKEESPKRDVLSIVPLGLSPVQSRLPSSNVGPAPPQTEHYSVLPCATIMQPASAGINTDAYEYDVNVIKNKDTETEAEDKNTGRSNDKPGLYVLAVHPDYGMQLLWCCPEGLSLSLSLSVGLASKRGNSNGDANTKTNTNKYTNTNTKSSLVPLSCYNPGPLTRLSQVQLVLQTRQSRHNPHIPDHILAICNGGGSGRSGSGGLNTGASIYQCSYGITLQPGAREVIDVPLEVVGGLRLLSLNYSSTYRQGRYTPPSSNHSNPANTATPTPLRSFPLVFSSRAAGSSGLVVLGPPGMLTAGGGGGVAPGGRQVREYGCVSRAIPLFYCCHVPLLLVN